MSRKTIRKPAKEFEVPFIEGPIMVRPLSALRYGEIEERFPVDPATKRRANPYAFFAAIMAKVIVEPDGSPTFEEIQLQTDFDADDFWALWDLIGVYLGLKDATRDAKEEGPEKNSPSANGSPSASLVS